MTFSLLYMKIFNYGSVPHPMVRDGWAWIFSINIHMYKRFVVFDWADFNWLPEVIVELQSNANQAITFTCYIESSMLILRVDPSRFSKSIDSVGPELRCVFEFSGLRRKVLEVLVLDFEWYHFTKSFGIIIEGHDLWETGIIQCSSLS